MDVAESIAECIGNTPLVRLKNIVGREDAEVLVKLEYFSPGGSIKDRAAKRLIEEAERSGVLKPGGVVVEATSGNMGAGLAVVCAAKGYRMVAVMSEGNSAERRKMLEALGAEVVLVPQAPGGTPGRVSKEDLELVEEKTRELVEKLGAFRPNQFSNPDNPLAHELTTGEEIWRQTGGRLDAFVCFIGTGGTFVGVARALKRHDNSVRCYPVEPAGAPFLAGGRVTSTRHRIQGGGYAFRPTFWDEGLVDGYLAVSDDEATRYARLLASKEGVFGGFSGGANVAAACRLLEQSGDVRRVVTVIPDSGLKYLSTDLYP